MLGRWEGRGRTNLKTKDKPWRGGEAWSRLLLPCTLPKCLNARRSRSQSWQLSVIIPATPRAPAPGSVSRAGERHLPGSDEMPVFVPAAASRPCRPQGGTASLPPLSEMVLQCSGRLSSLSPGAVGSVTTWHLSQRGSSFEKHLVTFHRNF